jgi:type I restriction enzyme S subunit
MSELNIPESWAETRLEVAGTWGSGGTPLKSKKDFYGGNINWLKTGDLNNGIITEVPDKITKLGLEDIGGRLYPPQTVVMAMYGATIGKLGILNIEVATNQACACCTTHQEIYYKYLFYWLMNYRKEYIALGQGGAQPNISRSLIYEQPFAIPPRPEQERIVQKIESCFDKIDATKAYLNKIETLLEKYRESLLAKAFRGELVLQDPNHESASVLLEKIRKERSQDSKEKRPEKEYAPILDDEKPFDLPAAWEWVRLGELVEFRRGHNPPKSEFKYEPQKGYVRFIQIQDFKTDDKAVYVPESKQLKLCKKGDIMVSAYRHIGKYSREMEGAFNVALCHFNPRSHVNIDYIELLIPTAFIKGALLAVSERSMIPSMSVEVAAQLVVPLAPKEIQIKLIKKLQDCKGLIADTNFKLKKLQKENNLLKESILKKAFEGRLVEQIPSEGTGHEILACILKKKDSIQKPEAKDKAKKVTKKANEKKAISVKGNKNGKK